MVGSTGLHKTRSNTLTLDYANGMTTANSSSNSCIALRRILLLVSFTFSSLLHGQTQFHSFTVQVHGTGKPVIFIPGLACPGSVWDTTVAQISGAYECHVITIAGFGGSPGSSVNPILPNVRDELIAYIREMKLDRPTLVGHSLGGFLALWIAEIAPQSVGKIVVVDASPFLAVAQDPTETPESARPRAEQIQAQIASENSAEFLQAQRAILATLITDSAQAEALAAVTSKSDPKVVAEAYYELLTTDLRPGLPSIRCPAILLSAPATYAKYASIEAIDSNFRSQYSALPQAEFVSFKTARHFLMFDEPQRWFEVLKKALATSSSKP
jgi:pimeloyl-ACP methyl ester carboxylesterase